VARAAERQALGSLRMTPAVLALAGFAILGLRILCLVFPRLIDPAQVASHRGGLPGDELVRFDSGFAAAKSRLPMYGRLLVGLGVACLLIFLAIGNLP